MQAYVCTADAVSRYSVFDLKWFSPAISPAHSCLETDLMFCPLLLQCPLAGARVQQQREVCWGLFVWAELQQDQCGTCVQMSKANVGIAIFVLYRDFVHGILRHRGLFVLGIAGFAGLQAPFAQLPQREVVRSSSGAGAICSPIWGSFM